MTQHDLARPTSLDDLRNRPTVPVWSGAEPSAAGALGIGRSLAYEMCRDGRLPALRLSKHKLVVPTAPLLAMLGAAPATDDGQDGAA